MARAQGGGRRWGRVLLALGLGLATVLLAAKAHGRQVRLEREHAGYHEVVFGGDNPPFVTALWRRDRVRFWTAFPALAGLLFVALFARHGWGLHLALAPTWGAVGAFALAGLRSLASLRRAVRERPPDAAWQREAARGSVLWWALVAVGAAASGASTLLP